MACAVRITVRAERDLDGIYEAIHAGESEAAHHWYLGLARAILSLEGNPLRWPVTSESKLLRHLLYGKKPHIYRVIFRASERAQLVEILHIRHGARDAFRDSDVD